MQKDQKRAVRRQHRRRLIRKRRGYWGFMRGSGKSQQMTATQCGIVARTPTPCSCWGCGYPRRIWGPTIAELRDMQDTGD